MNIREMMLSNPVLSRAYLALYQACARCWQHGPWILARHACLGRDVLKELGVRMPVVNIQKGRVDYILDCIRSTRCVLRISEVSRYVINTPLLAQQQALAWFGASRPPELVYMDSYS